MSTSATATGAVPADARAAEIRGPSRGRRIGTWIAIGIAALVIGGIGAALSGLGDWVQRDALDPDSAAPAGTRALAEILRDQGIEVTVVRERDEAQRLLAAQTATLVLPDAPALSDAAVENLARDAADVVLIEPRARTLRLLVPGAEPAGYGGAAPVAPGCELPDAVRSGPVAPGALFTAPADVTACYTSDAGAGLVVTDDGPRRFAAVDGAALFTNETLAEDGNAALGVNLMARHPLVVWYAPSLEDSDLAAGDPTLGELTPPWVSPVIVLLLAAAGAAAIWRGRRFGPLVAERLPVTVRAGETTEGRGRLYAHARDTAHAATQLRAGSLRRLSRTLGLGPAAAPDQIADAVAAIVATDGTTRGGFDRGAVRGILWEDLPATDRDLVALRDRLHDLEEAVHRAVRPGQDPPPERNDR